MIMLNNRISLSKRIQKLDKKSKIESLERLIYFIFFNSIKLNNDNVNVK